MGNVFQDSHEGAVHGMAAAAALCIFWSLVVLYAAFFGAVSAGTLGALQSVPGGVWVSALVAGVAGYWWGLHKADRHGVFSRNR
ncbi:hypothetical protein [Deinococcus cellulosilyticus]|uniref:Uncharacterized protein n=1 Tax=Deinococcus cellulosilyticus (strain DSM 18568 / NBRC 106333 / KACC 11606 / 5516J-15) TaxID=1223518 RepID=A0A511NAQ0_DEIC1|nr:hypothetical protein [Deinococcus cellulosilyticus]GEM49657.1 hypothetical protein DC3_52920 [Deinococcus cellulosilyticus NBRC 106333 = KACC 11606]